MPKRDPSVVFVSKAELQQRFNRGRFVVRALVEGYQCCLRKNYPVRFADEPADLESLTIGWLDQSGLLMFYAQCFRRPDGSLAASGLLDPKLLRDDDGLWNKIDESLP